MVGQKGSTPRDLFEEFLEEIQTRYVEDKQIIREIMKNNNIIVNCNTNFNR